VYLNKTLYLQPFNDVPEHKKILILIVPENARSSSVKSLPQLL
jgi:hypothetical protein